jgi:hypothetical protein
MGVDAQVCERVIVPAYARALRSLGDEGAKLRTSVVSLLNEQTTAALMLKCQALASAAPSQPPTDE